MPRSSWKGFLKLSLVSVPVQAFNATTSGGGAITLNQLHDQCHSRIRYQKVCPIHGEVPSDEIVRGYEFAKGKYAVIDPEEIEKLRTESDKAVNMDKFVRPSQLDPIYYGGRTYYLTPDGPAGQKPYRLLQQSMADEGLICLGQVIMSGKEQLVVLRPIEKLLSMSVLHYDAEVKKPAAFQDELTDGQFSEEELKLTKMLIEATAAEEVDLSEYKDLYTERMAKLIEAKVEGKELVSPPAEEEPSVISLMDALKASVQEARKEPGKKKEAPAAKKSKAPKRKMAPSAGKRKGARKSKDKKTG